VSLADLSIRRPVFAVMLIGALVVLGMVSLPRIDRRLFPEAELPAVTVTTRLAGAAPETVEREISQPLEESINTIDGIETLYSTSSEGLSQVLVWFEIGADPFQKAQDVRDKVSRRWSSASTRTARRSSPSSSPAPARFAASPRWWTSR
jgi:HAE1 family hydrophobic/amphiphilic exporter-1